MLNNDKRKNSEPIKKVKLKYLSISFNSSIQINSLSDTGETPVYGASGIAGYTNEKGIGRDYLGIVKDGAGVGRINCYKKGSLLSNTLCYIIPHKDVEINWLKYSIISLNLNETIDKTTIPHIYFSDYGNRYLYFTSFEEQNKVSKYLDKKTAEIDRLIEIENQQIEKLKEYKQAVITEAVTKGLDKSAPMKDSGVEWIGFVSEKAKITRIGHLFEIILGKMVSPLKTNNEQTLEKYLCAANVHFDNIQHDKLKKMWFSQSEKAYFCIKKGDLLIVEGGAGAGGAYVVDFDISDTYIQNSIMIVRKKAFIVEKWLYYVLYSYVKRGYIDFVCNKATIPHFTKEKLANTIITYYDNITLKKCIKYLDKKCADIDCLIEIKQKKIDKLNEYKKSLIYEYVTGKNEVG